MSGISYNEFIDESNPEVLQEEYEQIGYFFEFNDGHCSNTGYEPCEEEFDEDSLDFCCERDFRYCDGSGCPFTVCPKSLDI